MNRSIPERPIQPYPHNRWLVLIAAYKCLQAVLIAAIGFGALHLLGKDAGDELADLAERLHFNAEWRLVDFLLAKAEFLNDPLLRKIGITAFIYAGLSMVEGVGLYLEKTWAEYLTLVITASFLPWELVEFVRRLTWVRASLLAINMVVFLYLLKIVVERARQRASVV
jgi:uncharacterized membrane protein (DUF2068 family)